MKPSRAQLGARAQLGQRTSATALADSLLQTETSDGGMGRSSSALALPKLAGAPGPGQARRLRRAGGLRWRQCGGDKTPHGWCFGGKAPELALPGPWNPVHAHHSVDSYSGVLELAGTCAGPGSSGCPMGGFLELLGKLPPGQRWLGLSPTKNPDQRPGFQGVIWLLDELENPNGFRTGRG